MNLSFDQLLEVNQTKDEILLGNLSEPLGAARVVGNDSGYFEEEKLDYEEKGM